MDDRWIGAIGAYARRMDAAAGDGHRVVSPLGAWMVVALCAPLARGADIDDLARSVGSDPGAAAAFARLLLRTPHPLVAAGAALWSRPGMQTPAFREWSTGLPDTVDTGAIPDQAGVDAWARERTGGLIERFPLPDTARMLVVLASALAAKVSWVAPFDVVDAAALGPGRWAGTLRTVLAAPSWRPGHRHFIADDAGAGTVAVHIAEARDGLLVGSVIAASADIPPGCVLAAATRLVTDEAVAAARTGERSLWDLPPGDGPVWTLAEEAIDNAGPTGRREQIGSVLPAWSADTEIQLTDEQLGFPAAARAVAAALDVPSGAWTARQSATARYSATGFEAAAVTAFGVPTGAAAATRAGRRRSATLRFAHPYAVVAVAVAPPPEGGAAGPWHGLPVFSAWITAPDDA